MSSKSKRVAKKLEYRFSLSRFPQSEAAFQKGLAAITAEAEARRFKPLYEKGDEVRGASGDRGTVQRHEGGPSPGYFVHVTSSPYSDQVGRTWFWPASYVRGKA